ncbi:MAG: hypothetical protein KAI28_06345, partial [Sphingomonadales bacterium]|nr:hypothetical protein [Sphingomonadales bacterium]
MITMRTGIVALATVAVVGAAAMLMSPQSRISGDKHVAITQIVEHPALDAVRKGVKDVLTEEGYV